MPSWNDPTNSNPSHVEVLQDLADKDAYALTMGQTSTVYADLPNGTMKADNSQKLFRRRQSGTDEVFVLSLAGGGTGATSAAGARGTLEVLKAGTDGAEARTNTQNDGRFVQQTRTVSTTEPLDGGGALSGDLTLSIQDATTSQKGAVQLNNTLTSTSTSTALTAAQGKALKDAVDTNASAIAGNTSAIGALVDVGYYNAATVTLPDANDGTFSSGSFSVVRVGNSVTITGQLGFPSTITNPISSDAGLVPDWAWPVSVSPVKNCYDFISGYVYKIEIYSNGLIRFRNEDADGGLVPLRSSTEPFTISYTI